MQRDDLLPHSTAYTISDTSHDDTGLLGHLSTLTACVQLAINQHPLCTFPATLPQACSHAQSSCDQRAGLGTWSCPSSYRWPQPSDPACPSPSVVILGQLTLPFLGVITALNSFIQISNNNINLDEAQHRPLRTPLMTGLQVDSTPFTTTLRVSLLTSKEDTCPSHGLPRHYYWKQRQRLC